MARPLRILCVGWGAIMSRAAGLIAIHQPDAWIAAIAVRDGDRQRADITPDILRIETPEDLQPDFVDLVIEAAGQEAVLPWGMAALERAKVFAPLSVGAFAQGDCLARLSALAEKHGSRIMVPSGAIGGLDALRSMSYAGLESVTHEVIKPLAAWRGTQAEQHVDLAKITTAIAFVELSAGEAACRYPQNANVCAMVALAGLGLEKTRVRLIADPDATCNSHVISARGPSGEFTIRLDNHALAGNPKSSEMTALSLLRLVEQLSAPLVW